MTDIEQQSNNSLSLNVKTSNPNEMTIDAGIVATSTTQNPNECDRDSPQAGEVQQRTMLEKYIADIDKILNVLPNLLNTTSCATSSDKKGLTEPKYYTELQKENQDLQRKLAASRAENACLIKELDGDILVSNNDNTLPSKVSRDDSQEELKDLLKANNVLKTQNKELENSKTVAESERNSFHLEIKLLKSRKEKSQSETENVKSMNISNTKKDSEREQTEIDILNLQIGELTKENNDLTSKTDTLQNYVNFYEKERLKTISETFRDKSKKHPLCSKTPNPKSYNQIELATSPKLNCSFIRSKSSKSQTSFSLKKQTGQINDHETVDMSDRIVPKFSSRARRQLSPSLKDTQQQNHQSIMEPTISSISKKIFATKKKNTNVSFSRTSHDIPKSTPKPRKIHIGNTQDENDSNEVLPYFTPGKTPSGVTIRRSAKKEKLAKIKRSVEPKQRLTLADKSVPQTSKIEINEFTDIDSCFKEAEIIFADTKPNWLKRMDALATISEIVRFQGTISNDHLSLLKTGLQVQVVELRSAIVKEACSLLNTIAEAITTDFAPFLGFFLECLFTRVYNSTKAMRGPGDYCIRFIVTQTRSVRCCKELLIATHDLHHEVRTLALDMISVCLKITIDHNRKAEFVGIKSTGTSPTSSIASSRRSSIASSDAEHLAELITSSDFTISSQFDTSFSEMNNTLEEIVVKNTVNEEKSNDASSSKQAVALDYVGRIEKYRKGIEKAIIKCAADQSKSVREAAANCFLTYKMKWPARISSLFKLLNQSSQRLVGPPSLPKDRIPIVQKTKSETNPSKYRKTQSQQRSKAVKS